MPARSYRYTYTVGTFVGNTGSEGKGTKLSDTSEECTKTLLWVHQDNWQKELLVKYGTLIDATYKTTKYDLALFFLCVRTNVNYTVES